MAAFDSTGVPTMHAEKSPIAHDAAVMRFLDMQQTPIGTGPGDERYMGMPINYRIPEARYYVINHSRTRQWRRVVAAVSYRRGAEEAMLKNKKLRETYSPDLMYKQVENGRDMNQYEEKLYPAAIKLRVPGAPDHRGGSLPSYDRIIPPADGPDSKPLAVEVPEGTWDLYLGNYERMQGIVRDKSGNVVETGNQRVISDEAARLGTYWSRRHNPVFRWTDDGVSHDIMVAGQINPFGILEFVRVPVRAVIEPVNKEFLTALDIVEAA